jgi:OmpA-OmpF porin, OOP family
MRKYIIFIIFLLSLKHITAQNLVKNPSFENLTNQVKPCSYSFGDEFNNSVKDWKSSKYVTTDILYFDSLQAGKCLPKPRSGNMIAGFIAYHPHQDSGYPYDYHEFLQGELQKPLQIGKEYTFEYWLYTDDFLGENHFRQVLGDKSKSIISLFCNNIGVKFLPNSIDVNQNWRAALAETPTPYVTKKIILNTNGWQQIQFLITPTENCRYFYIGNFDTDANTETNLPPARSRMIDSMNTTTPISLKKSKTFWERKKRIAYYCIDDVSLREGNFIAKAAIEAPIFAPKSTYTFQHLTFYVGSADLVENSTKELDLLFIFLEKNASQKINIQGHTDDVGNATFNQNLSIQRAMSVKKYLTAKGVAPNRISIEGFGSLRPIVTNDTAANRAKNRRVEVLIIE